MWKSQDKRHSLITLWRRVFKYRIPHPIWLKSQWLRLFKIQIIMISLSTRIWVNLVLCWFTRLSNWIKRSLSNHSWIGITRIHSWKLKTAFNSLSIHSRSFKKTVLKSRTQLIFYSLLAIPLRFYQVIGLNSVTLHL